MRGAKGRRASGGCLLLHLCPNRELRRQGAGALTAVRGGKKLEYPVFVDMEAEGIAALGRTRATQLALYALEKLRAAGWYPGLYTYSNFAKNRLDMAKLSAYPFFVADYTGSVTYPGAYQMWQYSSTGRVPGHIGQCGPGPLVCGFSAGHSGGRLQWL